MYFKNDFLDITTTQKSLIVSLTSLGAAFGSLFSGVVSDYLGRKKVILVADIFLTVGALMQAFCPSDKLGIEPNNILVLMVGRIVVGIGVGIAAMIVPIYIAEISPTEIRGKIVAFNTFIIIFG